jgi:hypothetical protein
MEWCGAAIFIGLVRTLFGFRLDEVRLRPEYLAVALLHLQNNVSGLALNAARRRLLHPCPVISEWSFRSVHSWRLMAEIRFHNRGHQTCRE